MNTIKQFFDPKWVRKQFTLHYKDPSDLAIYLKIAMDKWGLTFKGLNELSLDNVRFRIVDKRTRQTNYVECYDNTSQKTHLVTLAFTHKASMCCVRPVFDDILPLIVSSLGDDSIDHLV